MNDEKDRLVEGYASVEIIDLQQEVVPSEALQKAMLEYMKRGGLVLYGHDNKPAGKVLQWEVMQHPELQVPSIKIIAQINSGYSLDDAIWNAIKNKQIRGFSIGGTAISSQTKVENNKSVKFLTGLELSEISLVSSPANPAALITSMSIAKSDVGIEDKLYKYKPVGLSDDEFKDVLNDFLGMEDSDYMTDEDLERAFSQLMSEPLEDIKEVFRLKSVEKGREKPEYLYWNYCIAKASKIPEVTNRKLAGGLCGYLYWYKFNADRGKSNEWAINNGKITDEDVEDWIMFHKLQHRGENPAMQTGSIRHRIESTPRRISRIVTHKPLFGDRQKGDNMVGEIVEVEKPFAGFKDFASCELKMKKEGYDEESAKKICGSLKSRYEKGEFEYLGKAAYAWGKCMKEQTKRYGSKEKASKVCGSIKAKYGKSLNDVVLDIKNEIFKYDNNIQDTMNKDLPTTLTVTPTNETRGDSNTIESGDNCIGALMQNGISAEGAKSICEALNKGKVDRKGKAKLLELLRLNKSNIGKGEEMKVRKDEEEGVEARLDAIEETVLQIKAIIDKLAGEEAALGEEEEEEAKPEEEFDITEESFEEPTDEEDEEEKTKSAPKKRKEKVKANIGGIPKEPESLPEDAGLTQYVRNLSTVPDQSVADGKLSQGKGSNVTGGIKDGQDNQLGRGSTIEASGKVVTLKGNMRKGVTVGSFPSVESDIQGNKGFGGVSDEGIDVKKSIDDILTGKITARQLAEKVRKIEGERVFI